MRIVKSQPPNIEEIRVKFTLSDRVVFTYGSVLWNPGGGLIPDDLMIHEETHEKQQGDDPAGWWQRYLSDKHFRLEQELEAYRNQYQYFKETKCVKPTGNVRQRRLNSFLHRIARDLSSQIYGEMISLEEAEALIQS